MNKNKYFSPGRFARLLRNDLMINQKTYLFGIVGLSLAIFAFSFLSMLFGQNFKPDNYSALFAIYLLGIDVYVGTAFPALSNRNKTTSYLLTPGSTFEKFMVQLMIRIVILIPTALVIFWLAVYLAKASLVANTTIDFNAAIQITDFHFNELFENNKQQNQIIFLCIFSFGTFLFAGASYFKRYALAKTLITLAIGIGLVFLLFVLLSHIFFPNVTHGFENRLLSHLLIVQESGSPKMVENPYNMKIFWYAVGHFSWLFFLPLAYFKLKEKEV